MSVQKNIKCHPDFNYKLSKYQNLKALNNQTNLRRQDISKLLYLDGSISVEENSQSIKDRKNLSTNGFLEITILITPKGNIHNNPIISFRGLPIYETDEFIFGLEEEIEKTTKTFKLGNKNQEHNLIDALKIASRKFTKEKTGKKPFTNINLVKI